MDLRKSLDQPVSDYMSIGFARVNSGDSVADAARVIQKAGATEAVVMQDDEPIGIVTERDIVRKIVAEGIDASKVLVTDVMTTPLITVSSTSSIEEASEQMTTYKIRYLPVVDEGEVVGMVATKDIALALAKEQNFESKPVWFTEVGYPLEYPRNQQVRDERPVVGRRGALQQVDCLGRTPGGEAPAALDLVARKFTATRPNELWFADITYVPTWAGFLYVAVVLDAWSRRVVGFSAQLRQRG
jgi:CBS domain-containing protein